jgi:PAP2 superfamily protein
VSDYMRVNCSSLAAASGGRDFGSRRAAAVQAAYEILVKVYPAQKADLDAKLEASLNGIASEEAVEHSQSVKRGIAWGQTVANAIWTWRGGDGINNAIAPYTGVNAVGFWRSFSDQRHLTFSENARLLALLNLAMADAAIGCWDAKYTYIFWRPITAIVEAANDGNPATTDDPGWTPLIVTPNHPDYPSGHSCVSGAAGRILSAYFGDNTPITIFSNVQGTTRSYSNFTAALEEVKNARVFAGIHFRTACNVGQQLGINVGDYILQNALLPVDGKR